MVGCLVAAAAISAPLFLSAPFDVLHFLLLLFAFFVLRPIASYNDLPPGWISVLLHSFSVSMVAPEYLDSSASFRGAGCSC